MDDNLNIKPGDLVKVLPNKDSKDYTFPLLTEGKVGVVGKIYKELDLTVMLVLINKKYYSFFLDEVVVISQNKSIFD